MTDKSSFKRVGGGSGTFPGSYVLLEGGTHEVDLLHLVHRESAVVEADVVDRAAEAITAVVVLANLRQFCIRQRSKSGNARLGYEDAVFIYLQLIVASINYGKKMNPLFKNGRTGNIG